MVNEHNQTICDLTKIILEDYVCLYPGYVEVKDGTMYQHFSDDPNNKRVKPGILKNRKEYRTVKVLGKAEGIKDGHYLDLDVMHKSLTLQKPMVQSH